MDGDVRPVAIQGGCDCHTHVFLNPKTYPFFEGRRYTPAGASIADLERLLARIGLPRVVVVQPSVYGADNSATLAAVRQIGLGRARGIAGIDERTPDDELPLLNEAGFRGVRANLEMGGDMDVGRAAQVLRALAVRIAPLGWHIQIYSHLHLIAALADVIATLPVPVVLDHFAGARAELGLGQPGFSEILDLLRTGRVYVKLSGAYRVSDAAAYSDVAPLARALIATAPDGLVWGSDWPHPDLHGPAGSGPMDIRPGMPIDDPAVLALVDRWTEDAAVTRAILVDTPERLYFT